MLRVLRFAEDAVVRLALVVIATSVFVQVVSRYLFGKAIPWTEELTGIAMVWAVYVGASIAVRQRFHIRIMVMVRLLPRPLALTLFVAGDILFLVFCAIMLRFGYEYIALLWQREFVSPALGIDQKFPHSIIVIAYLLIVLHTAVNYVHWYREGRPGFPGVDEVEGATAALSGGSDRA